jgi:hypothetical protein
MDEKLDLPEVRAALYRKQGGELRVMAAFAASDGARNQLINIADLYDQLALVLSRR